jgi:hypothetical protein
MPYSIPALVVAAGGLGTRVRPWSQFIPKEFHPVDGRPASSASRHATPARAAGPASSLLTVPALTGCWRSCSSGERTALDAGYLQRRARLYPAGTAEIFAALAGAEPDADEVALARLRLPL